MVWVMANMLVALIMIKMTAVCNVSQISGIVIFQKISHWVAPSMRAAS